MVQFCYENVPCILRGTQMNQLGQNKLLTKFKTNDKKKCNFVTINEPWWSLQSPRLTLLQSVSSYLHFET